MFAISVFIQLHVWAHKINSNSSSIKLFRLFGHLFESIAIANNYINVDFITNYARKALCKMEKQDSYRMCKEKKTVIKLKWCSCLHVSSFSVEFPNKIYIEEEKNHTLKRSKWNETMKHV